MANTFTARPTTLRRWETLTKAKFVLDGVFAAVYVLLAVATSLTGKLPGAGPMALIALSLASLAIDANWMSQTRKLVHAFGADPRSLGRHWSTVLSFVLVVAAYVVFARDHRSPAFPALLAVSAAPAMLALVKIRAQIRGIAAGGMAPRAPEHEPQPSAAPNQTVHDDTIGLAVADDDFWSAVVHAGGDAALLETSPEQARRWLPIPAAGDVIALRASIPAGAVLTLWPAPLATNGKPPAAPEYYGLVQAGASGSTRFQLVLPSRVAAFAAENRTAHRAALYFPGDPAARCALQPE